MQLIILDITIELVGEVNEINDNDVVDNFDTQDTNTWGSDVKL